MVFKSKIGLLLMAVVPLFAGAEAQRAGFLERLKTEKPFFIAHRGCQSLAPENTLASFVCAARLGLQAIETDVRLTKDGVLVCSHDASLKRMFGIKKKISDMTAEELRGFVPTNGNCIIPTNMTVPK